MKKVKQLQQTFKAGEVYHLAEGDELLPKYEYAEYFENSDEHFGGERDAQDRCKKTVKVVVTIYEESN